MCLKKVLDQYLTCLISGVCWGLSNASEVFLIFYYYIHFTAFFFVYLHNIVMSLKYSFLILPNSNTPYCYLPESCKLRESRFDYTLLTMPVPLHNLATGRNRDI